MTVQETAETEAAIIGIDTHYRHRDYSHATEPPEMNKPILPELDKDHVKLILVTPATESGYMADRYSVVIRKDDMQRLNLMVGDIIKVRISNES
jgi:hypothetical protein